MEPGPLVVPTASTVPRQTSKPSEKPPSPQHQLRGAEEQARATQVMWSPVVGALGSAAAPDLAPTHPDPSLFSPHPISLLPFPQPLSHPPQTCPQLAPSALPGAFQMPAKVTPRQLPLPGSTECLLVQPVLSRGDHEWGGAWGAALGSYQSTSWGTLAHQRL